MAISETIAPWIYDVNDFNTASFAVPSLTSVGFDPTTGVVQALPDNYYDAHNDARYGAAITTLAGVVATKASQAANLSDLQSIATARNNLGLGSAATHPATDFEPALGLPGANGYVLASTTTGTRSWVAFPAAVAPGGGTGAVQYKDGSGHFAGNESLLYYDGTQLHVKDFTTGFDSVNAGLRVTASLIQSYDSTEIIFRQTAPFNGTWIRPLTGNPAYAPTIIAGVDVMNPASVGLVIRGASGQTANLQEWWSWDGTTAATVASISPKGSLNIFSPAGGGGTLTLNQMSRNGAFYSSYISIDFLTDGAGLIGQFLATDSNYASSGGAVNLPENSLGLIAEASSGCLVLMAGGASGDVVINAGGYAPANERLRISHTGALSMGGVTIVDAGRNATLASCTVGSNGLVAYDSVYFGTTANSSFFPVTWSRPNLMFDNSYDGSVVFRSLIGTPNSRGSNFLRFMQNTTTALSDIGGIDFRWTNNVGGSQTSAFYLQLSNAGGALADVMQVDPTGITLNSGRQVTFNNAPQYGPIGIYPAGSGFPSGIYIQYSGVDWHIGFGNMSGSSFVGMGGAYSVGYTIKCDYHNVTLGQGILPGALSGTGVVGIANCSVAPSVAPTGCGELYVEAGSLKFMGSAGTVTVLAPA